jgi:hypothetical protein
MGVIPAWISDPGNWIEIDQQNRPLFLRKVACKNHEFK